MPNFVRHNIHITGEKEQLDKFIAQVGKNDAFSFQNIIPMPESLTIPSGSYTKKALDYAKALRDGSAIDEGLARFFKSLPGDGKDYSGIIPGDSTMCGKPLSKELFLRLGEVALDNLNKYGAADWYDWRVKYWGTKWDAGEPKSEVCDECVKISFDTAWSTPDGIWNKLAEMFPTLNFAISFADEDIGHNCGKISIHDGVCEYERCEGGTDGALEMACGVWNYDPAEFRAAMEET